MTAPAPRRLRLQPSRQRRPAPVAIIALPTPPVVAAPAIIALPTPPVVAALSAMSRYIVARLQEDPPDDPAFMRDLRIAYLVERARDFGIFDEQHRSSR